MSTLRGLRATCLFVLLLLVAACKPLVVEVDPAAPGDGSGSMRVGASRIDITPAPGFPMGGHSIGGKFGYGAWGSLHARAVYVEDASGQGVALVAMDSWAVSLGLRDRVIERLQDEHGITHLGPEHVILGASHTHHSSAAFASDMALNLGGGKVPSYSEALFEFHADRVATAVARAHARARPARMVVVHEPVFDFVRNRSIEPFVNNPEAPEVLAEHPFPADCTLPESLPMPRLNPQSRLVCQAVDANFRMVRFHGLGEDSDSLIAAMTFVNVHDTAMPNLTEFYNADVFGVAATALEHRLADEQGHGPVMAIFNGAEGDVIPSYDEQDYEATRRVASVFETAMAGMLESQGVPVPALEPFEVRYGLFPLAGQEVSGHHGHSHITPKKGGVGKAALGGGENGIVSKHDRRRNEGEGTRRKWPTDDGHGHKKRKRVLTFGDKLMPQVAPLTVVRLGDRQRGVTVVGLPGEFTTVMGRRVRDQAAALAGSREQVLIIGLANAYRSYFTTPEEYALQHYEGGQTWWGENAGQYVAERIACLVGSEPDRCGQTRVDARREYRPGPEILHSLTDRRRSPRKLTGARDRLFAYMAPTEGEKHRPMPSLTADFGPLHWPMLDPDATAVPHAWIEHERNGEWVVLRGPHGEERSELHRLLLMVREVSKKGWTWEALWLEPGNVAPDQEVRMVVEYGVERRCSAPFTIGGFAGGEGPAVALDIEEC